MDADKEGFLRSETSLIQTIGRTARNVNAKVYLYGDKVTGSMQRAIDETNRRRKIQLEYNKKHNITPETIKKQIRRGLADMLRASQTARKAIEAPEGDYDTRREAEDIEKEMLKAAEQLDFERAAELRDKLRKIRQMPEFNITGENRERKEKKQNG
jgi:excinuclease ABC subunit B